MPLMAHHVGVIKSFNLQKGWGFIECADTEQVYGKDIFVLKSSLPGGTANKGDRVTFSIKDGTNGPEACMVERSTVLEIPSNGHPVAVCAPNTVTYGVMSGWPMAKPSPALQVLLQQSQDIGQFFIGTIKSYNPAKGWGLIACDASHDLYGKDMFVLKSSLPRTGVVPGQQVSFSVVQGMKGTEASNVKVLPGVPLQQLITMPMQMPSQLQLMSVLSPRLELPAQLQNHVFCGAVKSFNEGNGWGMISCDATKKFLDKDMFVMKTSVQGNQVLKVGDQVQFSVILGRKGPEASNVIILGDSEDADAFPGCGDAFPGHVKSYNPEKGWGFIASDATFKMFNKDVFLHSRELAGHVPNPGDGVTFRVSIGRGGQPEATAVAFEGDYGPIRESGLTDNRAAPY